MQDNLQGNPVINFLKKIWPYIYRIINGIFYFIFSIIKNGVKSGIDQIKGM